MLREEYHACTRVSAVYVDGVYNKIVWFQYIFIDVFVLFSDMGSWPSHIFEHDHFGRRGRLQGADDGCAMAIVGLVQVSTRVRDVVGEEDWHRLYRHIHRRTTWPNI